MSNQTERGVALFQTGTVVPFGYKTVSFSVGTFPESAPTWEVALDSLRNTKELDPMVPARLVAVFTEYMNGNCRLRYWKDGREG